MTVEVILFWVKCCVEWIDFFVEWSNVLSEIILCVVKWCVEWNDIIEWSVMLNDVWIEVVCWVKSHFLSRVTCWLELYCWMKWWVDSSVVLSEVLCLMKWIFMSELMCWGNWYSSSISRYSSSSFHHSFYLLHSVLGLTSLYLLTVGAKYYCCTWSHSDSPNSVGILW